MSKFRDELNTAISGYLKEVLPYAAEIQRYVKDRTFDKYADFYVKKLDDAHKALVELVRASHDRYIERLERAYLLQSADIDAGDLELLRGGFHVEADDLRALIEKHSGNNTMLSAISKYAEEHDMLFALPDGRRIITKQDKAQIAADCANFAIRVTKISPDWTFNTYLLGMDGEMFNNAKMLVE